MKRGIAISMAAVGTLFVALGVVGLVEGLNGSHGGTDTQPLFGVVVGTIWVTIGGVLVLGGAIVARKVRAR